ncbi:MAG: TrkH family potassium uptake protein [Brevinematia bacterium]
MTNLQKLLRQLTFIQSLLIGFILIILIGSILLTLPIASSKGISQPFIDALFTATSAVSTTGLIVVDTGSFYSIFGQIVILILIEVGGLGYMTFIVFISYLLGKKLSLRAGITLQESLAGVSLGNTKKFVKSVIVFTFLFEFVGAVILSLYWMREFPLSRSIYLGIFHSVSAFCTAGFALFPDSFSSYIGSVVINLIISILSIAGGIGFFVLYDIQSLLGKTINHIRPRRLSIHSKLALMLSITLMVIGTGVIFISESGLSSAPLGHRLLSSTFQSITASTTTGFNTVDIGAMKSTSLFAIILLMFIGASPGGTGGGIKTTTFGLMLLSVIALLKGRQDVNIFNRRISPNMVNRAFAVGFTATLLVIFATAILTATEKTSFLRILFEVVSAFGTVGLSTGITSSLSIVGKIVITITMLSGRLGTLGIGFALIGKPKRVFFKYAEEEIFVG